MFNQAWRLAEIDYPEDKYRSFDSGLHGGRVDMTWRETCFCWCFWSLEVRITDLERSGAILVRAVDDALSVQPRDMYWSVLGMMNNPWFRVGISKEGNNLRFEHPTHPVKDGGWMETAKRAGADLTNGNWGEKQAGEAAVRLVAAPEIDMRKQGLKRQISLKEFRAESIVKPWFVLKGEVYDGTAFLGDHPGGAASITSAAGLDVSEDFLAIRECPRDEINRG